MKASRIHRRALAGLALLPLLAAYHLATAADKPAPATAAQCETTAKAWFAKAYGGGTKTQRSGRSIQANYKTYFDVQWKKCIVRVERRAPAREKSPEVTALSMYEGNPADKKMLGTVVRSGDKVVHCEFTGKRCKTVEDWQIRAATRMPPQ